MEPKAVLVQESALDSFLRSLFATFGLAAADAALASRSLIEASLMGFDSHGVEALDLYYNQLRVGGIATDAAPVLLREGGGLGLWDMQHGEGLVCGRKVMAAVAARARKHGIYMATCRRTNHIGACGVYARLAADEGLIGIVSQQPRATFAPSGGKEKRVGTSPLAVAAPMGGGFPFLFDASLAQITYARIKAHRLAGTQLPEGVAMDNDGTPTTDPAVAWDGIIMPIGGYKGVGLAMALELLHCVLAGGVHGMDVPDVVASSGKHANTTLFMIGIDPDAIGSSGDFAARVRDYCDYVESAAPLDPDDPPRYPGRRAGEHWADRRANGIPVSRSALARFDEMAGEIGVARVER